MQQLCISKDFINSYHIYQNNESSERVRNSGGNVRNSGGMSKTVGEMSATVGKLNML